jgi:hypothetical protein
VDIMPSALAALGLAIPAGLDGVSCLAPGTSNGSARVPDFGLAPERPDDDRDAESAVA